jgi:lincosamide nucleotidyltransferase A/C/D/E
MDAQSLLCVVDRLEQAGIDVWLDGGWGVDALLGRPTREHDDLDLVAELRHAARIIELLRDLGYELVAGGPPKSFVLVDAVGRQVDVHPVTFDSERGGVYEMEGDRKWTYPARGPSGSLPHARGSGPRPRGVRPRHEGLSRALSAARALRG